MPDLIRGKLWFGSGDSRVELPLDVCETDLTFTRGPAPWPGPILPDCITVSGTITGEFDAWSGFRDWSCPGCSRPFAELEPGHSWSSARGECWTEAGPIDEYGRPIRGDDDD